MNKIDIYSPHIYVAGPIGKKERHADNLQAAIDAAEALYRMGAIPIVPHFFIPWGEKHEHAYEEWMTLDFEIVRRADALYRMPGISPGADREVAFAEEQRIVVLTSLKDVERFVETYRDGMRREVG